MLGRRIQQLLDLLDLSQAEFAKSIGVSQGNLSNYISNKKRPSYCIIRTICVIYRVNETWLLNGELPIFLPHFTARKNRLLYEIEEMNDEKIDLLLAFLSALDAVDKKRVAGNK